MQLIIPGWTLDFLSRKVLSVTIPIVFLCINLLVLIFGAKTHNPGSIPRYWWPIISFLVYSGAVLYWLGFWVLQKRISYKKEIDGQPMTIGRFIGFEVIVHNETDVNPPEEMRDALRQSRLDGTRRRIQYKVSLVIMLRYLLLTGSVSWPFRLHRKDLRCGQEHDWRVVLLRRNW